MTENTENLVLEHLRAIRADMADLRADVREIKTRLGNLEAGQGSIIRHLGDLASADAAAQLGIDRLGDRVERIERRLEING